MSDDVDKFLVEGETVILRAKQHWWALIRFALQPILIFIAAVVCFAIGTAIVGDRFLGSTIDWLLGLVTLGLFLVAIVWFPVMLVRWISRRYALTNRRVIYADGLLRKRTIDTSLDQITDVGFEQGPLGRSMGFGDLAIATAAGQPQRFDAMIGATGFKKAILDAQEALVRERGGATAKAAATAAVASTAELGNVAATAAVPAREDPTETLAKLAGLRDSGVITNEEFEAKKRELLERV